VLAPADMALHSVTHLHYDGDLEHALRDLVDLHDLLDHFGREPDFWAQLLQRAQALHVQRPLFYALHHCERLLGTTVPAQATQATRVGAPPWPILKLMDALVTQAMMPEHPDVHRQGRGLALWLLYVRSHYLRMPLHLSNPPPDPEGVQAAHAGTGRWALAAAVPPDCKATRSAIMAGRFATPWHVRSSLVVENRSQ